MTKSGFCVQVLVACLFVTSTANGQPYRGILINGRYGGTQLYDPFNTSNTQGNLQLGLQTGYAAQGGAVINGQLAYFASGFDTIGIDGTF